MSLRTCAASLATVVLIASACPEPVTAQTTVTRPARSTVIPAQSLRVAPPTVSGYRQAGGASVQIELPDGTVVTRNVSPASGAPPAAAAAAAEQADAEFAQKKQQLLQQLTFDRRPSSILKAWATDDSEFLDEARKAVADAKQAIADAEAAEDAPDAAATDATDTPATDTPTTGTPANDGATDPAATNGAAATSSANPSARPAAPPAAPPAGTPPPASNPPGGGPESTPPDANATTDAAPAAATAPDAAAQQAAAQQAAAQEQAAAQQAEAERKAREQQLKLAEFQLLLARLRLAVTRGQWPEFEQLLEQFEESDRDTIYQQLLTSLIQGPPDSPRTRSGQIIGEQNLIRAGDVIALAELCPQDKLADERITQLGQLVIACQHEGEADYAFFEAIRAHVRDAAAVPDQLVTPRIAARIVFAAGRADEALVFLPKVDAARDENDIEALDLLSDAYVALHEKEAEPELLETAWHAVQAILEFEPPAEDSPADASADASDSASSDAHDGVADGDQQSVAGTPPASTESASEPAVVAGGDVAPPAVAEPDVAASGPPRLSADEIQQMQQKALRRAVLLVPRLREELGQQWLDDSFTRDAERGRRILNGIGTAAAKNMAENPHDTQSRLQTLTLQQTAVAALLKHAGESRATWAPALHLMAVNWLREAVYSSLYDTSSRRGPSLQRDAYGNYFWTEENVSFGRQVQNGMPQAIPAGKVLDARPSERWLEFLQPTFYPTLARATARLHLRVKEEAEAFPYIESLAETHPDDATQLIQEFLSVWADNHDPNSERRRTSVYMFSFGFNQRLSGIPLTRSHQQRNLRELADWVRRIRALPLEEVEESWIASAFTRVHSAAEVYQLQDLEAVFGSAETMEADTLASLLLTMRTNLNSVWRMPQVQQDAGTNRRKKDIESEVTTGYEMALSLCDQGLERHSGHWQLQMARGALLHDLANYQNDIEKSTSYTENRREALELLQRSARAYCDQVDELKETEFSVEAFDTWFYAALGDSEIGRIGPERNPMLDQIPLIDEVFEQLPSETAARHRDMFANDLFARMSNVNPAVKFRYVREGLKLAGDRMQAREARRVFDYYNDLVTEIQLQASIDGSPRVGHEQPFGVLVSIRHTKAIEREGGGFQRYLQNQNSGGGYYYNNGRPNEDYRDKFEQATRDAVDEHFEVLSVTFEPESIHSRPDPELGWRVTPYAYVLLKARGPEVDRVPPLRLDLDFLDTTGYVILPVESPAISVDCRDERGDPRPLSNLSLTQTLDEREADDGRLKLEIKAIAQGLIPELSELVALQFDNFDVTAVDDNQLAVSKFDQDSSEPVVLTERLWTVTLEDRGERAATAARSFRFPDALIEPREVVYQRYDDADLKAVDQDVTLEFRYDEPDYRGAIIAVSLLLIVLIAAAAGGVWYIRSRRPEGPQTTSAFAVPEQVTPFSVLALLKNIERNNGLTPGRQQELHAAINRIERFYFADSNGDAEPDLAAEARAWVSQVQ